jgi:photosystem II stability/assembly factor-like uncharacterized protein
MAARRRAVSPREVYPRCSMITGTAAVTFTRNDGLTLAPRAESGRPIAYTYGLASMIDEPDTLVAWHGDDLLLSTDAGCSWRVAATMGGWDFPPALEPARGGRVYAWSENRLFFARYDARGLRQLKQPVEFVGLTADAKDGERLRAGGNDGTIWETTDGGESWTYVGRLPAAPGYYRFAFNPHNLDHVVAGTIAHGAYASRDGGRTWVQSTGIGKGSANVFQLLFAPADPNRVWAMGLDLEQLGGDAHGRHIYVSDDGGVTFRPVVDEAPGVKLINGPVMAAHPTNRDVLYFVFGTHLFDYGTDLFRLDLATNALTMTHSNLDDVNAIAFSRKDPTVMYLGIEVMTVDEDKH